MLDQSNLIAACLKAGTVKRFLPSEYNVDMSSARSEVPDIFEPRAAIVQELQRSQIPYTLICSNGFMEYWNAGTSFIKLGTVRHAARFLLIAEVLRSSKVSAPCSLQAWECLLPIHQILSLSMVTAT